MQKIQKIIPLLSALFLIYSLFWAPAICAAAQEEALHPYIERHANGWIDWEQGKIYGTGEAAVGGRNSRIMAKRAASVMASGNIVKLAAGIHLDDAKTLAKIGSGKNTIHLEAFLRDQTVKEELVTRGGNSFYSVTNMADLNGVEGLKAKLFDHLHQSRTWSDFPQQRQAGNLNDDGEPWLVIDARNLPAGQVQPAILPKIVDTNGNIVYQLKDVEAAAFYNRGMMQYYSSAADITELSQQKTMLQNSLAQVLSLFSPASALANEQRQRRKRGRYIVKKAIDVDGLTKTNLVLSGQDAKAIKKEDASSAILKNCRVLVIVASPVGGIEGMLPKRFALRN